MILDPNSDLFHGVLGYTTYGDGFGDGIGSSYGDGMYVMPKGLSCGDGNLGQYMDVTLTFRFVNG